MEIVLLRSRELFEESTISDLESPSNFQVKDKKILKSVNKQGNCTFVLQRVIWGKYNIGFRIPSKVPSQRRRKIYWNSSRNNEIMVLLKMPKSTCLKCTYRRPSIDYRVALLFTRYLTTAIGIIPESLKSIGQF